MSEPLPVLPLRNAIILPGVGLPISAGRAQTLRAIEAALKDPQHRVFAVGQRTDTEEVLPESLYTIGTIATLGSVQRGPGGVRVFLQGASRGIALRTVVKDGYLEATVTEAREQLPANPKDPTFVALHREVRDRSAELAKKRGVPDEAIEQMLAQFTEAGALADLVAGYLDIPNEDKQVLLETLSVEDRLRQVLIHTQRQLAVASAQEDIQSKVKEELG
ncbi:MAG: LON peptidase substrate-binding domain-containing protein, partial [Acidobacteriota bacterium]